VLFESHVTCWYVPVETSGITIADDLQAGSSGIGQESKSVKEKFFFIFFPPQSKMCHLFTSASISITFFHSNRAGSSNKINSKIRAEKHVVYFCHCV